MGGQTWRLEQNLSHGCLRRGYGEWLIPHCWTSPYSKAAAADEGLLDAQSNIVSEMTGQDQSPSKSPQLHARKQRNDKSLTATQLHLPQSAQLDKTVFIIDESGKALSRHLSETQLSPACCCCLAVVVLK